MKNSPDNTVRELYCNLVLLFILFSHGLKKGNLL